MAGLAVGSRVYRLTHLRHLAGSSSMLLQRLQGEELPLGPILSCRVPY